MFTVPRSLTKADGHNFGKYEIKYIKIAYKVCLGLEDLEAETHHEKLCFKQAVWFSLFCFCFVTEVGQSHCFASHK